MLSKLWTWLRLLYYHNDIVCETTTEHPISIADKPPSFFCDNLLVRNVLYSMFLILCHPLWRITSNSSRNFSVYSLAWNVFFSSAARAKVEKEERRKQKERNWMYYICVKYIFVLTGIHNGFARIILLSFIIQFYTVDTDLPTITGYILFYHKHTILCDRWMEGQGQELIKVVKKKRACVWCIFVHF